MMFNDKALSFGHSNGVHVGKKLISGVKTESHICRQIAITSRSHKQDIVACHMIHRIFTKYASRFFTTGQVYSK